MVKNCRFISIAAGLAAIEEIHQKVDPSDEFESLLYEDITWMSHTLADIYKNMGESDKQIRKEVMKLIDTYFEAYETVGFDYKL